MAHELMNGLINKIHDAALERSAAQHLRGTVIDVGCGIKPYAGLVAPYVDTHFGVDHPGSAHDPDNVDAAALAYALPFRDESFDGALCTMVLEHLEEPEDALVELQRTLKADAPLLISVPFIWHLHEEPRDFYRYSHHGLRHLLERAGFEVIEMEALGGFWVTVGQMFAYYLSRFDRGIVQRAHLLTPIYLLVQATAGALDRLHRAEAWTWAYLAVARRRAS